MLAALAVAAFLGAAAAPARVTASDYEDFESCYGSFEGASTVLPQLKSQIDATDFATIEHAMQNLASVANPKFASTWATLRANFGFKATLAIY